MITKELLKNEIDTVENKQTDSIMSMILQWVSKAVNDKNKAILQYLLMLSVPSS